MNSNGVKIGTFDSEEWYYLAFGHEKKFLGRSEVKAIINGKQVKNSNLDFPKVDKAEKFTHAYIAKHFCGQISS